MPLTRRRELQLSESESFHLWLELGSLSKVSKRLEEEGRVNQSTEKPFTKGGIRNSAFRYIIYNPDDAYAKMKEVDPSSPYLVNQESWYRYLAHRAREVFYNRTNEDEIFIWAEDYDIPEEYIREALKLHQERTEASGKLQV